MRVFVYRRNDYNKPNLPLNLDSLNHLLPVDVVWTLH